MNPLKCEIETVIKVEYHDLDNFIKSATGHDYEVVPNEEWSNDSQHEIFVDGILDKWSEKDWLQFKILGRQDSFLLRPILNGLCSEGKIRPGNYLITVSW